MEVCVIVNPDHEYIISTYICIHVCSKFLHVLSHRYKFLLCRWEASLLKQVLDAGQTGVLFKSFVVDVLNLWDFYQAFVEMVINSLFNVMHLTDTPVTHFLIPGINLNQTSLY